MNEKEFSRRFEAERPMLEAWGDYVVSRINNRLEDELPSSVNAFLKIPPAYRVKDLQSAITKAFIKKRYKSYDEMTDKVGVRFVVLLTDDIELLCKAIEEIEDWSSSKDRDYDEEREREPLVFDYQSVHYVVYAKKDIEWNGAAIQNGTPCEIQVRTILQHAYSELTHDTIYKPKISAKPEVKRMVARSMALIETTDEIFCKAKEAIEAGGENVATLESIFDSLYSTWVSETLQRETKLNALIIDAYSEYVSEDISDRIENFIDEMKFVPGRIKDHAASEILFRQPAVLLVYYLVKQNRIVARKNWPLTEEELRPFFTDLGIAL